MTRKQADLLAWFRSVSVETAAGRMSLADAVRDEETNPATGKVYGPAYAKEAGMDASHSTFYRIKELLQEEAGDPPPSDEGAAWTGGPMPQAEPDAGPRRVRVRITEDAFASLGDPAKPDPMTLSTMPVAGGPVRGPRITFGEAPENREPVASGEEAFRSFMAASDRKLARHYDQAHGYVRIEIETDSPVAFTNLGDLHLGNRGTDHRRALEDAHLVRDTPGLFAIFGGDGIDNFIKHASAMVASTSCPEDEYAALEWYLSQMDGKLLGGITGNHDYWTKGFAGIDYLRDVFRRLQCPYGKHTLRPEIVVNGISYKVESRHGYRFKSALNLSNSLQRMYDFSEWQWDVGLTHHTHDGPFVVPFDRHGKQRWGGLCGSYKVKDDHSRQWGFNDATPSSPVFILDHRERAITGIPDLRRGVAFLNAIRNESRRAA